MGCERSSEAFVSFVLILHEVAELAHGFLKPRHCAVDLHDHGHHRHKSAQKGNYPHNDLPANPLRLPSFFYNTGMLSLYSIRMRDPLRHSVAEKTAAVAVDQYHTVAAVSAAAKSRARGAASAATSASRADCIGTVRSGGDGLGHAFTAE